MTRRLKSKREVHSSLMVRSIELQTALQIGTRECVIASAQPHEPARKKHCYWRRAARAEDLLEGRSPFAVTVELAAQRSEAQSSREVVGSQ
jgi:pyrroloquinoline quinone (PQQ) biosynthesis protein C